jgi:hypothetical protein
LTPSLAGRRHARRGCASRAPLLACSLLVAALLAGAAAGDAAAQATGDSLAPRPADPAPPQPAAPAASTGVIAGVVLDQEDRLPLPNARVGVYRPDPTGAEWVLVAGSLTDDQGAFRYAVAPGVYRVILSYQSYVPTVKDDIVVAAGAVAEISVTLVPRPLQVKGVEVKGEALKSTEAATLQDRKKAAYVSDAISAEQISKSTDSNAAEALQRVTGLSVVEGKYVFVRGLGERYSSTQVNGTSVGTPEPNKRVVPLDIFPAGSLDAISVQKTYTPDQDGEFAGGVIQLQTKDFTGGRKFSQSFSTGYSVNNFDRKPIGYEGGRYDFLGFDDGARDYPDLFKKLAGDRRIAAKGLFGGDGFSSTEIQELGRSFNKTWSPRSQNARPNYSYAATFGQSLKLRGVPVGLMASLSLSNGVANQKRENNAYAGTSTRLDSLYLYDVDETTEKVLWGGLTGITLQPLRGQTLRVRSLYTRQAEDVTRVMQGPNYKDDDFGNVLNRISSLDYVQRGLFSNVVSGDHVIGALGNLGLNWKGSYSEALREEPDRRESVYESDAGVFKLRTRTELPITRIFGAMNETDRSASGHLMKKVTLPGARELSVKAGGAWRERRRTSSFRRLGFQLKPVGRDSIDRSLPPELLLVDENIRSGYFELAEGTRENDTYRAAQTVRAAFVMADVPIFSALTLTAGVRHEVSDQAAESRSPFVSTAKTTYARLRTDDYLPAANLTWRMNGTMNVRGGYSETLSRPELRELSPFSMYNYETGQTEEGTPDLKATTIENLDLRWEYFLDTKELFAVSLFHKTLYQPIESVVLGSTGGYITKPRNGRDGRLEGVEVEARLGVRTIYDAADRLLPLPESGPLLDRWALSVNYARVNSNVRVQSTVDDAGLPVFREAPLQGQSTYSLNLGLYYGTEAFDATILLSTFGERLAKFGAASFGGNLPDIYEHPPVGLDLTMSRRIAGGLRLKLSGENLLDESSEFRQLDLVTRRSSSGRAVSLSLSVRP